MAERLQKGISAHSRENPEITPLTTADSDGDDALINVLIQYSTDASDGDTNGWTNAEGTITAKNINIIQQPACLPVAVLRKAEIEV